MTDPTDLLRQSIGARQHAYKATFEGPLATEVLVDLAEFCRAHESTFHENPGVHASLDGRRAVWLRIQEHLQMTPEDLWALHFERIRRASRLSQQMEG